MTARPRSFASDHAGRGVTRDPHRVRSPTDPYELGLSWLARRELTERQLRERLRKRRLSPGAVDAAIERLRQNGALDERRTAFAYARTSVRLTTRGRRRVIQELAARGIDADLAREAVDAAFADVDEPARLAEALAKRLAGPIEDAAHLRRLHRALERLGFSTEMIVRALDAHVPRDAERED